MSYICTADLHLGHLVPVCRKETPAEWLEHQRNVLTFIANKCNKTQSDLIIAGDSFDKAIVSEEVVNMFLDFVNSIDKTVVIIHGNHELRNRSRDMKDTSFGIVKRAYALSSKVLVDPSHMSLPYTDLPVKEWMHQYLPVDVAALHTACYETEEECVFGGCTAQELLDKIEGPQFIIVGDHHHGFHYTHQGRHVINCGCVLKRVADFKEEALFIWHIDDTNQVLPIALPPDDKVYDEHRVEIHDRDGRISILLEKLASSKSGVSVDFVKNVLSGLTDCGLSEYTIREIKKFVEVSR